VGTSIGTGGKRRSYSLFPGSSTRDEETDDDEIWENERDPHLENERRGRRRVHELDAAPYDAKGAPGFGSGRSGIKDRERRGVALGLTSGASLSILEVNKRER